MKKKLFTIIMSLALMVTMMPAMAMTTEAATDPYLSQPLCFTALESNASVKIIYKVEGSLSFQYSTNGTNWSDYSVGTDVTLSKVNDKVYFRAKSTNLSMTDLSSYLYKFETTGSLKLSGNILSLLYQTGFENKANEPLPEGAFYSLFDECDGIKDASNFRLPSTKLSDCCYTSMFQYCKSLVSAPPLPATELAPYCYDMMFKYCESLINPPDISAVVPVSKGICPKITVTEIPKIKPCITGIGIRRIILPALNTTKMKRNNAVSKVSNGITATV